MAKKNKPGKLGEKKTGGGGGLFVPRKLVQTFTEAKARATLSNVKVMIAPRPGKLTASDVAGLAELASRSLESVIDAHFAILRNVQGIDRAKFIGDVLNRLKARAGGKA